MDYGLKGRVVVITGAAGGIGAALTRAYGAQGARLVLIDRAHSNIKEVADSLPGESLVIEAELTDDASVAAAVARLRDRCADIDVLVNNAGTEYATPLRTGTLDFMDKWDALVRNNVGSMVRLTRALLPLMRSGASIINQSSIWGLKGVPEFSAYVASKHAVIGVTRSLAWELAASGIRVNAVCPGWVQTEAAIRSLEVMAQASSRTSTAVLKEILAGQVTPTFLQPSDLAGIFLFLASDGARAISGQALVVSHGEVMN
jgi:NAD(P)-dependent dehydrogenase (short-subunit alcohol dehydrogenase family)